MTFISASGIFVSMKAKRKLRLCGYHKESLGWDACSDGFVGCQVAKARRHFSGDDCKNGRHHVSVGMGNFVKLCDEHSALYITGGC